MKAQPRFLSIVPPQEEKFRSHQFEKPAPRSLRPVVDLDETLPIVPQHPVSQPPETLPMKCLRCQGPIEHGTAPVSVERNGYRIAWESVPAWICTRCELSYFEPREVER
ncbi:MAG TPA: hypothetical protein VMW27_24535, partial [Thermoanaerobaculia bacterium]|nr:hypothetical protein [Thermoanaerobaculia bacterium]